MTTTENNVAAQAGDEPMRQALQVCIKALEFRKERSANDEFALNLARITLAGSPRATADVERVALEFAEQLVRMQGYVEIWMQVDHACAECIPGGQSVKPGFQCGYHQAKSYIATTKPGA